jgi:citrate synthase
MTQPPKRRHVGEFLAKGDWSDYWTTRISRVEEGRIWVRGYPLEEIVERLSFVKAMWLLIRGEHPTKREAALWELLLKVAMDQQFISAATCAARFVASAHPEYPIPGVAAGILDHGTVTGPPRPAAEMIYRTYQAVEREGLSPPEAGLRTVDADLARGESFPGLGHPIHKTAEPRAELLRRKAQEMGAWGPKAQLMEVIQEATQQRIDKRLPINLAGMMAALYCELGFDPLEIEALAAISYGFAIVAHMVEEIKEGVPLCIIAEALGARYAGPPERHIPHDR